MFGLKQGNPIQNLPTAYTEKYRALKIIISIIVLIAIAGSTLIYFTRGDIKSTTITQLNLLKQGKYEAAYKITAKSFQEATTFEVFEAYVKNNTVLSDYKNFNFSKIEQKNGNGYLKGVIEGEDGGKMNAEYQLTKENGKWKIQAVRLTPIGLDSSEATMQTTDNGSTTQTHPSIHGIMISDEADQDGYVEETKPVVPRSAKKIYTTVMIISTQPDINVEAVLKHLPSGVVLGPIASQTTKAGNIMKAFSFTRDQQLWPAGEYEIDIKLSSGDAKVLTFEIK